MRALVPVFALSLFSYCIFAQQPSNPKPADPDKAEAQVHKLSTNLYMIQFVGVNGARGNFGGNVVGLFVGDDGIALVDAGYAPIAPKLAAALKTISDKPVKYLLNTHWHIDHTEGDPNICEYGRTDCSGQCADANANR